MSMKLTRRRNLAGTEVIGGAATGAFCRVVLLLMGALCAEASQATPAQRQIDAPRTRVAPNTLTHVGGPALSSSRQGNSPRFPIIAAGAPMRQTGPAPSNQGNKTSNQAGAAMPATAQAASPTTSGGTPAPVSANGAAVSTSAAGATGKTTGGGSSTKTAPTPAVAAPTPSGTPSTQSGQASQPQSTPGSNASQASANAPQNQRAAAPSVSAQHAVRVSNRQDNRPAPKNQDSKRSTQVHGTSIAQAKGGANAARP